MRHHARLEKLQHPPADLLVDVGLAGDDAGDTDRTEEIPGVQGIERRQLLFLSRPDGTPSCVKLHHGVHGRECVEDRQMRAHALIGIADAARRRLHDVTFADLRIHRIAPLDERTAGRAKRDDTAISAVDSRLDGSRVAVDQLCHIRFHQASSPLLADSSFSSMRSRKRFSGVFSFHARTM